MSNNNYEIGYKKPPKETQFKKGVSGNPRGRPKGSKNTIAILNDALEQKISVAQNGKVTKINKKTAILMQMVNKATQGDLKSIQTILPYMIMIDNKNDEASNNNDNISQTDKDIIELFLRDNSDDK